MPSARMNLRRFSRYIALAGVDWLPIAVLPDVPRPAAAALVRCPSGVGIATVSVVDFGEPAKPPDTRTAPPPKSQDRRVLPAGPVCLALASALAAFRVRVWEVMSRGQRPRGGARRRRALMLPILSTIPKRKVLKTRHQDQEDQKWIREPRSTAADSVPA